MRGYVTASQLVAQVEALSERRKQLIQTVQQLKLVSGGQLRRLQYKQGFTSREAAARQARADLQALTDRRMLRRITRRVGGVRAGSDSYIYSLGAQGHRLKTYWAGQGISTSHSVYEPSDGHVDHQLAVSEAFVALHESLDNPDRDLSFRIEPECWRRYPGALGQTLWLKPDAELTLRSDGFEDAWWLEIDRATEHLPTVRRKLAAYQSYHRTGREQAARGVFPLTAWLTPDPRRTAQLQALVTELPSGAQRLFCVTELTNAPQLLKGETS